MGMLGVDKGDHFILTAGGQQHIAGKCKKRDR